jgi:hypothetical protein
MATKTYPTIGTNPTPFYVPHKEQSERVYTGQGYFCIQVYGAQAAFSGPWWVSADRLIVKSKVNLHLGEQHELGNHDLHGILQYREMDKDNAVQLGFSPILVDFVPAKMKRVSISIEYIVNKKNHLGMLAGLINNKDLLAAISLAPGAAMVARTVGSLAEKLITAFVPQEECKPILQFSGDFDLATEGLKDGYYVILGSHNSNNPLPVNQLDFEIANGGILKVDDQPITNLSYVILKVGCVKAVRDHFTGYMLWRDKIQEAKRLVQDYTEDPFKKTTKKTRQEMWEKQCIPLLREAYTLLLADVNFLSSEVDLIYRNAYKECRDLIVGKQETQKGVSSGSDPTWELDTKSDRAFLGIPEDEDMDAKLSEYADQLFKSRATFREFGLR